MDVKVNLRRHPVRIGELARATGTNRRLLRYYEEQGLLSPVRLANGYRQYTDSDVAVVRHIRSLLAAGLPTVVIARLLGCVHDEGERMVPSACPEMISNLKREHARVTAAISQLRTTQQVLDSMLAAALRQRAEAG